MRPHTPARIFLLLLVGAIFVVPLGLWLGMPYISGTAYLLALAGVWALGDRRSEQKAPPS